MTTEVPITPAELESAHAARSGAHSSTSPNEAHAAPADMDRDIEKDVHGTAMKATAWSIVKAVFANGARLISNIILAKLLVPEDFGLMGLVMVYIMALDMFSDFGIGPCIIQSKRGNDRKFLNTIWTIHIIRGFVIFGASCALAWPIAQVYPKWDMLIYVLPVAGLSPLIRGFLSNSWSLLARQVRVRETVMIEIASQTVSVSVMIIWALISPSVWALVAGALAYQLVFVTISHFIVIVPVGLYWEKAAAMELFHFGKWIFGSTVIVFLAQQVDRMLGGKLLGKDEFGVYVIAFAMAMVPVGIVNHIVDSVAFPLLSSTARTAPHLLAERLTKGRGMLYPMLITMAVGIFFGSRWFFEGVYDIEYHAAAWMTIALLPAVWFTILGAIADRVLLAVGNTRALAVANIVRFAGTVTGVVGGFYIGQSLATSQPQTMQAAPTVGFIFGTAVGPLFAYLLIGCFVRQYGVRVFRIDIVSTLGLAAVLAASWFIFDLDPRVSAELGWRQAIGPVLIIVAAGLWMMRQTLPALKKRTEPA